MLDLGKEYPELQLNKALHSKVAKILGSTALGGAGFETGRKLIR